MNKWMKVWGVALAAVVGLVPAFAQVSYAQAILQPVPVFPIGDEVPDEELLEVEGEFWWFWLVSLAVAGALSVYHMWFDGEPGISRDDVRSIVGVSAFAGLSAHWTWSAYGLAQAVWYLMR